MRIALVLFLAAAAYALDITPYLPIGLQDGVFDNHGTGSTLSEAALEGPFRLDRDGNPVMPAGRRTFHAPDFEVDLALLVTPSDAPDIDGDGKANDVDDDDDGHPDGEDAFPLEPEEWADAAEPRALNQPQRPQTIPISSFSALYNSTRSRRRAPGGSSCRL